MDGGSLDLWIERNAFDVKKGMELSNNGTNDFESRVVKEWRKAERNRLKAELERAKAKIKRQ
eukprot:scaffold92601_cov75-Cyclotella_meneghiniana.AAC.1